MTLYGTGWLGISRAEPGPPDKVYTQPNAARGLVLHSAVGGTAGLRARLNSTERNADGRYSDYAAASWHFTLLKSGTLLQHYSVNASCWASGSRFPNTNFVALEAEGGLDPYSEPLTAEQARTLAQVIFDLMTDLDWPWVARPTDGADVDAQLYEHRECIRWWSAPTACPSDRYDWPQILHDVEGLKPMNPTDEARVTKLETRLDALAKLLAERAVDTNNRLVVVEDKLHVPHA